MKTKHYHHVFSFQEEPFSFIKLLQRSSLALEDRTVFFGKMIKRGSVSMEMNRSGNWTLIQPWSQYLFYYP